MSSEHLPDPSEKLSPEEINSKLQSLANKLDRSKRGTESEIIIEN